MHDLTSLYQKSLALPQLPGIYIMQDSRGGVLYVGKAKRLKNRVTSYFRYGQAHDAKTERMLGLVHNFDYIVTDSEFEALLLECSLIKQHMPKYNILLKDDRGFSYIRISKDLYPRLSHVYQKEDDGARYLGPYISAYGAKKMLESAMLAFQIPDCERVFPKDFGKARTCLNHHIGRCMGVCSGKITRERYLEAVEGAINLMTRGRTEMQRELEEEMRLASDRLEYEKAARLRDIIRAIVRIHGKQKIIQGEQADTDVFAFAADEQRTAAVVLSFRDGVLSDKREEFFQNWPDLERLREEFVTHYYLLGREIPKRVLVDEPFDAIPDFEKMLTRDRGHAVSVLAPMRGEGRGLVLMAYNNAVEALGVRQGGRSGERAALGELANLLGLSDSPARIEAFDISNYGEEAVAGMSVFENGVAKKAEFRRFIIKRAPGIDDYGAMREAVLRRVHRYDNRDRAFSGKPDLLLLDGGKGHVGVIKRALAETSFSDVPVFGMVKDNRHHTRELVGEEGELHLSGRRNAFTLVSKIQNETHGYAVRYLRDRQSKKALKSVLQDIKGIGAVRAKALQAQFPTLAALRAAKEQELRSVKGMNDASAKNVYRYFHT